VLIAQSYNLKSGCTGVESKATGVTDQRLEA